MAEKKISLSEFDYNLPEEKIARFPLQDRDASKLLFYNSGKILHKSFVHFAELLPKNSALYFNDTRVVRARLIFQKGSGSHIEIFPIEPSSPPDVWQSMATRGNCTWKCMVGNLKRWKTGKLELTIEAKNSNKALTASLLDRNEGLVQFDWNTEDSFAEILEKIGNLPLPPYLKREATRDDLFTYQTVYSVHPGGVASPTAGLHFTPEIMANLKMNSVPMHFLTLHVSAGTFKPVSEQNIINHSMHQEEMIISKDHVESLLSDKNIIAIGTTSMRTLESIYWYGVKILTTDNKDFYVSQNFPYESDQNISKESALKAVLSHFDDLQATSLVGKTQIFIYPGYRFRICQGLLTNFHLPKSSLLMLASAFIGSDWKEVYQSALDNHYRFLSYGDSSLLLPNS